ncbi:MAG: intradiol ring-cleavage dioxygenase [Chloroflexi bacterium]|nr:intradiol ring-cleavage dioxygenase [Chloroflexota bacterium]
MTLLITACGPSAAAGTPPTPTVVAPPTTAPQISTPVQSSAAPATPVPTSTASASTSNTASALACTAPAQLTPALTEGPYFKAGSPERASLIDSTVTGTKLVLTGYVVTTDCKPVANAKIDFWQADAQGNYDNQGYRLRGHVFSDASGRYQVTTIVPGLYPGRTEHIHVKVQTPGGNVLTSQLFFPDVASNQRDNIYNARLLVNVQKADDGYNATYNFVVRPQ